MPNEQLQVFGDADDKPINGINLSRSLMPSRATNEEAARGAFARNRNGGTTEFEY
jgi:hypothetical protein